MTTIQSPVPGAKLRTEYKTREPIEIFLHPGIAPVVVVSDLSGSSVADTGYPRDAMGHASVAAGGAGTNAQCVCVGVGLVGKIYKVTRALISKPAAGLVQINLSLGAAIAGLADLTTKGFLDQRISAEAPSMQIASETPLTAAIDGIQCGLVEFTGADMIPVDLGIVLGFGGFLNIVNLTTNETLRTTFFWTEYLLEDR